MLALIDGDVLCYMACKSRWQTKIPVMTDAEGNLVTYKVLDADGNVKPLEFDKDENRKYLEECWSNFKELVTDLVKSANATDYLMAMKGENNFRNLFFPEYKMHRHRDPSKQNQFVPLLRQLAIAEDYAIAADNCEADDMLCTWAAECDKAGKDYIVCSIDKDLNCIPGLHYDIKKNIMYVVSETDALRNYHVQLLRGDPTDNIEGIFGIGEVMANRLVEDCKTLEEFRTVVSDMYKRVYKEQWRDRLLLTGRMTHLLRHKEDFFNLDDWPEPTV